MMQQKGRAKFEAGPVTFIVQHELWDGNVQDHSDQGVAVLVAKQEDETTLLRFNCFDIEKSYIYGPEKEHTKFRMDHTTDGNPINWTIQQIRNNLSIMLETAGYGEIGKKVDAKQVEQVLGDVESTARELYMTGRNTVKHNRGTDIFEVGNIRFGLEMRRQTSGDGGLAIHVLAMRLGMRRMLSTVAVHLQIGAVVSTWGNSWKSPMLRRRNSAEPPMTSRGQQLL